MILTPEPSPNRTDLRLANQDDEIVYRIPDGMDWVVVQFDTSSAWTTSAVVTAQFGLTQAKFYQHPDGAVTYTAVGLKKTTVTGLRYMRLYPSTPQSGSDVVTPTVNAGKNN